MLLLSQYWDKSRHERLLQEGQSCFHWPGTALTVCSDIVLAQMFVLITNLMSRHSYDFFLAARSRNCMLQHTSIIQQPLRVCVLTQLLPPATWRHQGRWGTRACKVWDHSNTKHPWDARSSCPNTGTSLDMNACCRKAKPVSIGLVLPLQCAQTSSC